MSKPLSLSTIDVQARPSTADQVFEALCAQILSLELPPGTRLSEVDVARAIGVSRQPVRDAFYRLSRLGFLLIRPQRATTVTLISARDVERARFIRTALEVETIRKAVANLSDDSIAALDKIITEQAVAIDAGDKALFHRLDDAFHREICARAGAGFVWTLIAENKGHMDRVRMLSLSFASRAAWDDHVSLVQALKDRSEDMAVAVLRRHLSRINEQIEIIRDMNHDWFAHE